MEIKNETRNGKHFVTLSFEVSEAILAAAPDSKSGKTKVVASTHGFVAQNTPAGVIRLSLNAVG